MAVTSQKRKSRNNSALKKRIRKILMRNSMMIDFMETIVIYDLRFTIYDLEIWRVSDSRGCEAFFSRYSSRHARLQKC